MDWTTTAMAGQTKTQVSDDAECVEGDVAIRVRPMNVRTVKSAVMVSVSTHA